jgi:hypothetical protein
LSRKPDRVRNYLYTKEGFFRYRHTIYTTYVVLSFMVAELLYANNFLQKDIKT